MFIFLQSGDEYRFESFNSEKKKKKKKKKDLFILNYL